MSDYYDGLAPYYKLMYFDWEKSVERQATNLDSVIKEFVPGEKLSILDAACGIGTQSLGLAESGYSLTASDLSAEEIEIAQAEAKKRDVQINFSVADMRSVWDIFHQQFDVVIACDNSIPHLLTNEDILQAFRQFYACTKPGGGCIISVRDYAELERPNTGTKQYARQIHQNGRSRTIVFDIWDFQDEQYEMSTYLIFERNGSDPITKVIHGGRYYCIDIPTLETLFVQAGFSKVITLRERFFQPLIIALKQSE